MLLLNLSRATNSQMIEIIWLREQMLFLRQIPQALQEIPQETLENPNNNDYLLNNKALRTDNRHMLMNFERESMSIIDW